MNDNLGKLRELLAAATPEPWSWGLDGIDAIWAARAPDGGNVVCLPPPDVAKASAAHWPDNAALIVAAKNALPDLLDTIDPLQSENGRLWEVVKQIASCETHHPEDVVAVARDALNKRTTHG